MTRFAHRPYLLMLFSLVLGACGGGGGNSPEVPSPPPTFQVGGTATGIRGTGLVLRVNGAQDLPLAADGSFKFSAPLASGVSYLVTIASQPSNPEQTCLLGNAGGTIANAEITNVSVTCVTNTYDLGGTVNGLAGSGLVLRNNGGMDLGVNASGIFSFSTAVESGSDYEVTVHTQPSSPSQTCVVTSGTGRVGAADVSSVVVDCVTNTYSVGGSTSGLVGDGLVLTLNGMVDLGIAAEGVFEFPGELASGDDYEVTVKAHPTGPHQTCLLSNASGGIGGMDVANVTVTCTNNSYAVGGTVSGLTGSGLVLQLNGGQDLPVAADGSFVFPTPLASGGTYSVSVKDQSNAFREFCVASDSTGTVAGSAITSVTVHCTAYLSFVYIPGDSSGALRTYAIHPDDGELIPFPSTVSIGTSPRAMVVAPDGRALYAANYQSNTVVAVGVDPDRGTLSPLGSLPVSVRATGANSLAISPSGSFLYVANDLDDTITRFSVDATTGQLTNEGVVATAPAANDRIVIAITPDGAFLYSLAIDFGIDATVTAYAIEAATGALTAGPTLSPGLVEPGFTIDPMARALYLRRWHSPSMDVVETTLLPYSIDSATGALTAVGTGTTVFSNGQDFAIDPSGRFAYLLDAYNGPSSINHLDSFVIDQASFALTSIGTPTPAPFNGWKLAFDPSGRFLFAGSHGPEEGGLWHDVNGFEIAASGPTAGQLTPAGQGTSHVGTMPGGGSIVGVLAVLP